MDGENIQKKMLRDVFESKKGSLVLRMAPMIDIIFLLLIFFLVAARWRPEERFLPIKLSAAQAGDLRIAAPDSLIIELTMQDDACRLTVAETVKAVIYPHSLEQDMVYALEKIQLTLENQKRRVDDPVEIVCSEDLCWDYLAKIYNILYGAGMTDITFRMTE